MTKKPKIVTNKWRGASSHYGTVNGKFFGPFKSPLERDAAVDSEVLRLKRDRKMHGVYEDSSDD